MRYKKATKVNTECPKKHILTFARNVYVSEVIELSLRHKDSRKTPFLPKFIPDGICLTRMDVKVTKYVCHLYILSGGFHWCLLVIFSSPMFSNAVHS